MKTLHSSWQRSPTPSRWHRHSKLARSLVSAFFTLVCLSGMGAAHPSEEMEAVRLALKKWGLAILNQDFQGIEESLHEEFRFNDRLTKEEYLTTYRRSLPAFPITRFIDRYAFFEDDGDDIRATPVVMYRAQGTFKDPFDVTLRKDAEGWKIYRLGPSTSPVPLELVDIPLPEQHVLYPVRLHLRDKSTRKPVYGRVHVRDRDGHYWPPQGHQKNIPTGWREDVGGDVILDHKTWAYVQPDFTLPLAEGAYTLEVIRGIEYHPAKLDFQVSDETVPELEVILERWSDVRREGWVSGDTHVHFLDPETAFLEGRAEDLNVVNILATKWAELITDVQKFRGAPEPFSDAETVVYVNEESRHHFLGHTVLMNLKDLVYPLTWGSLSEGVYGGIDYPAMAMQADKTHRQGGIVSWAHFPYPNGEVAIDIALGKVDSVDLFTWGDAFRSGGERPGPNGIYYRFLNCGFDLAATAGTDKMWNTQAVGVPRTYARIQGELTYQKWADGVVAGRTFVTTGPMLTLDVDGHEPGDRLSVSSGHTAHVRASLHSRLPVQKIEIVQDGKIVARQDNPQKRLSLEINADLPVDASSWVVARAYSSESVPYQIGGIPLMAHTSPVYLQVAGKPRRSAEDAAYFLHWVDRALSWLKEEANLPLASQRQEMRDLFERAREVFQAQVE